MSSKVNDIAAHDAPPSLPPGSVPDSLPSALYDVVMRHDRLPAVSPAAARALLARCLDRRRAGPLDLTELAAFLREKGAAVEAVHEVVLALSAVAPALKDRVSLPPETAALSPKERALLVAGFVARCPAQRPMPGVLVRGPIADDFLSSVVTGRWARRRRLRVAAGVALAVLCAGALFVFAQRFLEEANAPAVALPVEPPPSAPLDEKQARAMARFEAIAAERYLKGGDTERALASARKAVALDPGHAEAQRALASAALRAGHAEEACNAMRAYVERSATEEPARARLLASACGAPR